ncbi:MAG: hypothetical protein WAN51_00975 [Alphaproteobacteria bacterium]
MKLPLDRMQSFIANGSVTASAVRGRHGGKGVMRVAIKFLSELPVKSLVDPKFFPTLLDEETRNLQRKFPPDFQFWGTARKCLNIFLRGAFYNVLLRETYDLGTLDEVLETPLDSHVAKGLKRDAPDRALPRWQTIIGLTPKDNALYQEVARDVARKRYHTYRVNLDLWYWRT